MRAECLTISRTRRPSSVHKRIFEPAAVATQRLSALKATFATGVSCGNSRQVITLSSNAKRAVRTKSGVRGSRASAS